MTKIDLKSAYDNFTQEDLFRSVVKENVGDASEYQDKDIKKAKAMFGTWKDIDHLSDDLLKMYKDHYEDIAEDIDERINFYIVIDYSSMLQDDIFSGFMDILKLQNGKYIVYMPDEGIQRSNLTKVL